MKSTPYRTEEEKKAKAREWRLRNKDKERQYRKTSKFRARVKSYGLTEFDYYTLLQQQNSSCAICETHTDDLMRSLAIDHCHTANKVRGLLCGRCNLGLGYFKDNQEFLIKAIMYLSRNLD